MREFPRLGWRRTRSGAGRAGEHGVALMLTLGILSLVLILAMSFAFTARTERMAAAVNADVVKARLMCESGLERAIATIQYGYRLDTNNNAQVGDVATELDNVYPAAGLTAWNHAWGSYNVLYSTLPPAIAGSDHSLRRLQGLDRLVTTFSRTAPAGSWRYIPVDPDGLEDGNAFTPDDGDGFFAGGLTTFNWLPVLVQEPDRHDLNNTNAGLPDWGELVQRLTGRLAFLIIDESGRIDPSAVLNNNEGGTAEETTRPGNSIKEIDLNDVLPAGAPYSTFVSTLWADTDPTRRVFSWRDLYSATSAPLADAHMANLVGRLAPGGRPEPISCRQFVHQYDLSDIASIGGVANLRAQIPWLQYWLDADKGTFATGADRANQVAANLIDYCDADSIPTRDAAAYPTYLGLEKVLFINDIRLKIQNVSDDADSDTSYETRRLCLGMKVEMINVFSAPLGVAGDELTADVLIAYQWSDDGVVWTPGSATVTIPAWAAPVGVPAYSNPTSSYKVSGEGTADLDVGAVPTALGANPQFRNITVEVTKLFYSNSAGDLLDCVKTPVVPAGGAFLAPNGAELSVGESVYVQAEVNDPRQNINADDWSWTYVLAVPTVVEPAEYAGPGDGNHNGACSPNPGGDKDLESGAVEPWDVSSAYIRNDLMTSLAELGIVHRGAAWETLNLTKFSTASVAGGARAYNSGDRNILDDVRLAAAVETPYLIPAKVNPNSPNQVVLEALFKNIRVGDRERYPGEAGGTALSVADATAMATTVRNVNGTVAGYPMSGPKWGIIERMGNTFYNTRHAAPLNALNDRKIEVALLHTNALMSTKYNQFSILVIAQAIQDMLEPPSDPGGNAFDHTDDNGNEAGYGYYDTAAVIANHVPALPVQIPDRILAEQKIMARVVRNGLDAGLEQNFTDLRSSRAFTFLGKYPANGHRYYLSTSAVTWLEAQRICETNGGYLVTLGDANERNWLKAQVDPLLDATVPAEAFYWIGLYRVRTPATTSEYAWVTAEPFCPGNATYYPPGPHPAPFWAAVPGGNTTSGVGAQETVVKADSTHSQATATEYYIGGATNTPVEWRFVMECEPSVTVDRYEFIEE